MPRPQRIRDPLHNLIEFDTAASELEDVLWRVVQTRPFQRLRRVKQLGFSDLVYPGATHSRLAHSLGVFHTARRLMQVIRRHVPRPEDSKMTRALTAALVHDVGHGPFSHAFEKVGKRLGLAMADHERVGDRLIRDSEIGSELRKLGSGLPDDVANIISGDGQSTIYSAVVSSQFDADRLDYMRRDRLMTGTQHGAIDFEWLMANLEVAEVSYGVDDTSLGRAETFVLGPKAILAAEAFVLGLFQLYPTVYFHKATRGAEMLFTELLAKVIPLVHDGDTHKTGLPEPHPLVRFAQCPDDLECALELDDTVVWGALSLMAEATDRSVAELAWRLRDRKLYKCVDVRVRIAREKGDEAAATAEADEVCAGVGDKLAEWEVAHTSGAPRILLDEGSRSPYKRITDASGPLDQINIRTDGDRLVDLATRSSVVAAIAPFKLFRIYLADEDVDARRMIDACIGEEIAAWPQ